MTVSAIAAADTMSVGAGCKPGLADGVDAAWATFHFECLGPDGEVKWTETCRNIVTTAGKQLSMDVTFGATAKPTWYVLLKGTGAVAAGDTMASHAGWTEVTAYSAATRPTISFGAATVFSTTGAQVTNGTAVAFAINANSTVIAGAGVTTTNDKGGTTGILYNIGDFASSRTMGSGDTLNTTITLQQNP